MATKRRKNNYHTLLQGAPAPFFYFCCMNNGVSFTSIIGFLPKLKMHFVEIPAEVLVTLNGGALKGRFSQRVIIELNSVESWNAGVVALGEGKGYITVSNKRLKILDLQEEDEVNVKLTIDNSEYGHEFPLELEEVLKQDPVAKQRFAAMSPGKQRTIIYYILQVKSSDKRIERSLLFMENLKRCEPGKETMRALLGKE